MGFSVGFRADANDQSWRAWFCIGGGGAGLDKEGGEWEHSSGLLRGVSGRCERPRAVGRGSAVKAAPGADTEQKLKQEDASFQW